eukprot:CAMPEP_0175841082 /NCGR_PEP_ID=MMETSP0107_2-20121207/19735_1 /TAXON_ID=195067 ORGANISM="Goniomonas pacifica, Strain CCMP1869" /NCGR_SAMPLE_ID=MMETSP0107_2 /ASSEMBLY_ACC=CAM_ASM_000203 /LENGTH=88 /DNA_ID=CAMNT_0017155017 /DNA_START=464 /DNA_END=730 /DNA_ORIENTATION=-
MTRPSLNGRAEAVVISVRGPVAGLHENFILLGAQVQKNLKRDDPGSIPGGPPLTSFFEGREARRWECIRAPAAGHSITQTTHGHSVLQ